MTRNILVCFIIGLSFPLVAHSNSLGLDRKLNIKTIDTFYESCGKALVEIKDANKKEMVHLGPIFDFTGAVNQRRLAIDGLRICEEALNKISEASQKNLELNTLRDSFVWSAKKSIDEAAPKTKKYLERYETQMKINPNISMTQLAHMSLHDNVSSIKSDQARIKALTGENYGPTNLPDVKPR